MTEVTISIVVFNTPYTVVLRCLAFVLQSIRFATKASENRLRCSVCLINNSAFGLSKRLADEGGLSFLKAWMRALLLKRVTVMLDTVRLRTYL